MTFVDSGHVLAEIGEADVSFAQAAIGMAIVGFDGRFLRVNRALCEITGRSEQQLLGLTWQAITHQDDVRPGEQEVDRALGGDERTFRLAKRYLRPNQRVVWVLLSVSSYPHAARGSPLPVHAGGGHLRTTAG